MLNDKEWKLFDRMLRNAVVYLMTDGWPSKNIDERIADQLYSMWLKETHYEWESSGYRDRDPMWNALGTTLTQRYGAKGAKARMIVLSLRLECRSRREGQARSGKPNA
ncbi:MAG: hypothetical protein ABI375_00450 [Rudaea sp.]